MFSLPRYFMFKCSEVIMPLESIVLVIGDMGIATAKIAK